MKTHIILTIYILVNLTVTLRLDNVYEVIIVGAGISGLRASQILASHKIPHLIIQSTDHIGGRITSLDFQGKKVDKGACFIHNSKAQNPLGEIAKNMGLPWMNGTYNYKIIYYQNKNNNQVPLKEISDARQLYFDIVDTISERLKKQRTMMRADVLKRLINREFKEQSQLSRDLVNFMLYIEDHVDGSSIEKLSTKMKEYKEAKYDISLMQGMHQFFHTIFRNIDAQILFNKRVTSIDYSGALVKVQTSNETFYAKKVLSSLPLGVLKQNIVKFIPPLAPQYQKAIQNIGVSIVDKLFVSFERPFWSNNTRWISFLSKRKHNRYPVAFIMPFIDKNILLFFVTQQDSLKISSWSKQELIRDLNNFLTLFHKKTSIWIRDVKLTKWHQDENTYGSYSKYSSKTSQDDYTQLSENIDQKLWFIGEHTHPTLNSYAHGAYLSGQKAAEEVSQLLGKPTT